MSDIAVSQPITVTLKAGEWLWLLGVLATLVSETTENRTLDSVYSQVMQEVD